MKPDFYTRLYLWLIARRRSVLFFTFLIMAICMVISSRIRLEEDILDILPKNDQRVEEYKYALRKFRQIDRVYIDVGINADDTDKLAAAADEMFAGLSTNDAFLKITYRFEISGQTKVIDYLTGALPNLFTDADAAALEKKLDPAEVRSYLTTMRRKLAGPEGMVLKDVVAADPIGSTSLVLAKVTPLQTGFGDAQIVDGRITSSDGRHVLMMAEPKFSSSNSRDSVELVHDLLRLAGEVESRFPGVHVAITGGHRMSVDNSTIIKTDATRCILIGTAGMIVLCVAGFRRRWLSLLTFLPSLFSTLVAGVVLALWQRHLSAIATGFATIALGITVDYAIYIIYHLDDAASSDPKRVGRHLSQLVFPIIIGALTTIAAFLVMMVSPIQGYQQLGIFGAIGVVFSVAFAIVILPLLVPMSKTTGQPPLWLTRWWEGYFDWQSRRRSWLIAFVIVITIVTAFGVRRLRFEGDVAKLNGITEATRRDDALISDTWGSALGMTLVVARGATPEEALAKNDRAAEILARNPNVSEVYSLASVCPSPETQAANLKRWREFWTVERRDALRKTLEQVGGELGFRSDAFAKFWQTIEHEPPLLTPDFFRATPLEQALNERVAFGKGDNAVSTLVKLKDREHVEQVRQSLPGLIVLDHRDFVEHIARLARSGLRDFAVWTAILVAGILYLTMASVELVTATLLPLAFGMLWTFGAMGWLGLSINLMNSVFVIFIIGVAEDYSVFLVTSKLDEWRGLPKLAAVNCASVLISALTTIFGIGVLVIAKHPVLYSMGTTVLLGMVAAFIATLILTPFCMDLLLFKDPPTGAPRWWHPLGTLWVSLYLGVTQFYLYYVLRPILKIFSPRTALDRVRRNTSFLARVLVKTNPFGKLEFQNIRPETFSPACIVVSNHQSAVDVMLVVSLPGDVRQTAKKRVFDAPMLGFGCKVLGHVQVEPNDPQTTLSRCRDRLAEGACVHFYPEGTRSPDGFVRRFHRGAFELAVELKQEILPIVICDSNAAVPRDAYWFEPYHTTVTALPRVTPQNFDYSQGSLALMRHCEQIVREGLQRQLDQLNTPRVVRRKVNRLYRYQGKFAEQFVYWKLKTDPVFEALDAVVPRQGFILDLGCGYGIATHWLASFTDGRKFLGVDYDEGKIRVARRSAPGHERIQFEFGDILEYDYPPCDVVLLLDVLHYWTPAKQQAILDRARRALRPGGRLILRDGARAEDAAHRRVDFWERFATRIGHNQTVEGLHFQTLPELEAALKQAGFASWELKREAGRDSNVMFVAKV
jgi:1-acyl-sn-glycerol-3-phosphate acyltransferase